MMSAKRSKLLAITLYSLIIGIVVFFVFNLTSRMQTRGLPEGSISLNTEYSQYLVGEEIRFVITNNFNSSIYVNNTCPSEPLEVYRLENESWVRQHYTSTTKKCTNNSRSIEVPARTALSSSFKDWQKLFEKPGKYRIATYVDYYAEIPYSDFEIIEKPVVPEIPKSSDQTNQSGSANNPSPSPSPVPSPSPTPTSQLQAKTISLSAGVVSVEYSNSVIYVRSIVPSEGYTYEGGRSGTNVEITFKNGENEIQLQLSVRNGQLVQKIESD